MKTAEYVFKVLDRCYVCTFARRGLPHLILNVTRTHCSSPKELLESNLGANLIIPLVYFF